MPTDSLLVWFDDTLTLYQFTWSPSISVKITPIQSTVQMGSRLAMLGWRRGLWYNLGQREDGDWSGGCISCHSDSQIDNANLGRLQETEFVIPKGSKRVAWWFDDQSGRLVFRNTRTDTPFVAYVV